MVHFTGDVPAPCYLTGVLRAGLQVRDDRYARGAGPPALMSQMVCMDLTEHARCHKAPVPQSCGSEPGEGARVSVSRSGGSQGQKALRSRLDVQISPAEGLVKLLLLRAGPHCGPASCTPQPGSPARPSHKTGSWSSVACFLKALLRSILPNGTVAR